MKVFLSKLTVTEQRRQNRMRHYHLSLSEKVKVIEAKEKNKPLVREIMLKFKCGKTQIYETLKHKDEIVSEWMQRNGQMKEKYKFLVRYSKKKKTVTGT